METKYKAEMESFMTKRSTVGVAGCPMEAITDQGSRKMLRINSCSISSARQTFSQQKPEPPLQQPDLWDVSQSIVCFKAESQVTDAWCCCSSGTVPTQFGTR